MTTEKPKARSGPNTEYPGVETAGPDVPTKQRLPRIAFIVFIVLVFVYLLFSILRSGDTGLLQIDASGLYVFNTIFMSILMQAFPFMLIGVLVSSLMHIFVPDRAVVKAFPERAGLGYVTALLSGLLFPVCECAIVPVTARLVKKGVSLPIAVTFMLAAPIINPIAIISTVYAFWGQPQIALYRVCFGLIIALLAGLILSRIVRKPVAVLLHRVEHEGLCDCCGHDEEERSGGRGKTAKLFLHAGEEFFSVGKYLVVGAFIASLIQAFVPKDALFGLSGPGLSLVVMMAAAFLFSACSTSDAFIARSFSGRFPLGAVMGFMVFGPMMDVKNLSMLLSSFKKEFVVKLVVLVFVLNFVVLYFLSSVFLG